MKAFVEISVAPALLVKPKQPLKVSIAHITAVGSPRQSRDDLSCARVFVSAPGWAADKDLAAARCVSGSHGLEGARDGEHFKMGMPGRVSRVGRAPNKGLQPGWIRGCGSLEECGRNDVRTCLQRYPDVAALIDLVAKFGHIDEVCFEVGLSTHAEEMYPLSIDGVFDLVLVLETACHSQVGAEHTDGEDVIRIQRSRKIRQDSTYGADRHAFKMDVLRGVLPNTIRFAAWRNVHVPNGQRTDSSCRVHITLEQHRRNPKDISDVVKTVGGIVRRQQDRWIDFERQQIADRVAVFGAVQTPKERAARIRVSGGVTIEFSREPGDQASTSRVVGLWHALWGHHPDPHLADDLFPDVCILFNMGEVQRVERQPSGFGALVMARDAVLIEDRAVISRLRRDRSCSTGGNCQNEQRSEKSHYHWPVNYVK